MKVLNASDPRPVQVIGVQLMRMDNGQSYKSKINGLVVTKLPGGWIAWLSTGPRIIIGGDSFLSDHRGQCVWYPHKVEVFIE